MNTIIHDIMKKVITNYEKVMDKLVDDIAKGKGEISEVNKKLEEILDEIGIIPQFLGEKLRNMGILRLFISYNYLTLSCILQEVIYIVISIYVRNISLPMRN